MASSVFDQHWFREWLGAWWHQAIIWTNVDISPECNFTGNTLMYLIKIFKKFNDHLYDLSQGTLSLPWVTVLSEHLQLLFWLIIVCVFPGFQAAQPRQPASRGKSRVYSESGEERRLDSYPALTDYHGSTERVSWRVLVTVVGLKWFWWI